MCPYVYYMAGRWDFDWRAIKVCAKHVFRDFADQSRQKHPQPVSMENFWPVQNHQFYVQFCGIFQKFSILINYCTCGAILGPSGWTPSLFDFNLILQQNEGTKQVKKKVKVQVCLLLIKPRKTFVLVCFCAEIWDSNPGSKQQKRWLITNWRIF